MWTYDEYRRRGKWVYIVLASLVMIPFAYGVTSNWGVVILVEPIIVGGGYAGDYGFRKFK